MFNYDYLNELFDISKKVEIGFHQQIEDPVIQRKYFSFAFPKERRRNLVFSILIFLWYMFNIIYLCYKYGWIGHVISLIIALSLDIFLFLYILFNHNLKWSGYFKLFRFLIIYILIISWAVWAKENVSIDWEIEVLRVIHFIILLSNVFYAFYLDHHLILALLMFLTINITLLTFQLTIFIHSSFNIYSEIIVNLSVMVICFFFKKGDNEMNKELFCNTIKSGKIIEYFEKQINDLNANIINLESEGILYMNQNFINMFYQNFNCDIEQISKFQNDSEIGEIKYKIINKKKKEKNQMKLFEKFCNFFMKNCKLVQKSKNNNKYSLVVQNVNRPLENRSENSSGNSINNLILYYEITGDNLLDIIIDLFNNFPKKQLLKDDIQITSTNFNRIGEFCFEGNKKMYFDLYFRISIFKGKIHIDTLIYDVSLVKVAEKIRAENKFKQRMFSKIAHEFKTPLTTIVAISDKISALLKENNINIPKTSLDLNDIDENLKHIVNLSYYTTFLINDMILYSSESNYEQLSYSKINLKETLSYCFNILKTLISCDEIKKNSIEPILNIHHSVNKLQLISDELALKQIILNYICNSLKFTKKGFIKIEAEVNNDYLQIVVRDTGIGIKKEENPLIFNDNISIEEGGDYKNIKSCVGLRICKKLATGLNLEVKFDSEYEKYSNFYLIFNKKELISEDLKEDNILALPRGQLAKNVNLPKLTTQEFTKLRKVRTLNNNYIPSFLKLDKKKTVNFNSMERVEDLLLESEGENLYRTELAKMKNPNEDENITTIRKSIALNKYEIYSRLSSFKNTINNFNNEDLYLDYFEHSYLSKLNFLNEKPKILVIEDHNLIRKNVINIVEVALRELNMNNYEVIGGSDGIEMLSYVMKDHLNNNIKCIFTDENMVFLNGSEAIKIIKKLEELGRLKKSAIVTITAFVDDTAKKNILSAGSDHIISKPCTKSDIINVLKKYL